MAFCPIYGTRLVREGTVRYCGKAESTTAAGEICRKLLGDSPSEQVVAVLLDAQKQVIGVAKVSSGTLDCSLVHPREFFRPAILANAQAIIMAHNHPSGNLEPSSQDIDCYRRLTQGGELLGIACLDSIIVSDVAYFSLRDGGYR